jgi:hypothetical protein
MSAPAGLATVWDLNVGGSDGCAVAAQANNTVPSEAVKRSHFILVLITPSQTILLLNHERRLALSAARISDEILDSIDPPKLARERQRTTVSRILQEQSRY